MPVLSISAEISSGHAALLFFSWFMAFLISSLVGWSHFMGRSTSTGCMSGLFILFSFSVKLWLSSHNALSFAIFNWSFWLQYLSASFLVVSYSSFMFPLHINVLCATLRSMNTTPFLRGHRLRHVQRIIIKFSCRYLFLSCVHLVSLVPSSASL